MANLDTQDNTEHPASRPDSETRRLRQLAEAFGLAADTRYGLREGHARDASYYAGLIAREMGCSEQEIDDIEMAALLHGIGKVAIPDTILQKTSALEPFELAIIRRSTASGGQWLQAVEGFEQIAVYVRHQGERWDGTGYPDKLAGEAIPVGARILSVALSFAAMIRPRADRPAMSVVNGALEFLAYDAGLALDPKVVRAFLVLMGREFSEGEDESDSPDESAAEHDAIQ